MRYQTRIGYSVKDGSAQNYKKMAWPKTIKDGPAQMTKAGPAQNCKRRPGLKLS